jgi:hypothetical protein
MKSKLSVLALGIVGLLVLVPSCGADEGTGDGDDGGGDDAACTDLGTPSQDDRQCREGRYCSDVDGNMNTFCEPNETCRCVGVDQGGGGTTGSGGTTGTGGATGGSATGGTGAVPVTALGEPCVEDGDCGDAPMFCLLPDGLLDGSGPPNGLCTLPCDADDLCLEYADAAYCVGFEEDANMMPVS